jgi:hypothetical protein
MEYWEFLLQKKDDPAWNIIQSPSLNLEEGKYRVVAHCNLVNTKVEIRVIHQFEENNKLRRRCFKRFRSTNGEGLVVIIPFTHLKSGLWQFTCYGDLMTDLMGKSWQKSIQFNVISKVLPKSNSLLSSTNESDLESETIELNFQNELLSNDIEIPETDINSLDQSDLDNENIELDFQNELLSNDIEIEETVINALDQSDLESETIELNSQELLSNDIEIEETVINALDQSDLESETIELDSQELLSNDIEIPETDINSLDQSDLDNENIELDFQNELLSNDIEIPETDINSLDQSDLESETIELNSQELLSNDIEIPETDINSLDQSDLESETIELNSQELLSNYIEIPETDINSLDQSDLESETIELDSQELLSNDIEIPETDINSLDQSDLESETIELDSQELLSEDLYIDDTELKQEGEKENLAYYQSIAQQLINEILNKSETDIQKENINLDEQNSSNIKQENIEEETKNDNIDFHQEENIKEEIENNQTNIDKEEDNDQVNKNHKKEKGLANVILQQSIQDLEKLLEDEETENSDISEDKLIKNLLEDSRIQTNEYLMTSKSEDFDIFLEENTFVVSEENKVSLKGKIYPIKDDFTSFQDADIQAILNYQLRNPETGEIKLNLTQNLTTQKFPLFFEYEINIPQNWKNHLIVGHINLDISIENQGIFKDVAEQIFTVTLGVNQLLEIMDALEKQHKAEEDKINHQNYNSVESKTEILEEKSLPKLNDNLILNLEDQAKLQEENYQKIDLFDATKVVSKSSFTPVNNSSLFYKISKTSTDSSHKIKSPQLPDFVDFTKPISQLNNEIELNKDEDLKGKTKEDEEKQISSSDDFNLDFSYKTSFDPSELKTSVDRQIVEDYPSQKVDNFSIEKAEERFWLRLNSFANDHQIPFTLKDDNQTLNQPQETQDLSIIIENPNEDNNILVDVIENLESMIINDTDTDTVLLPISSDDPDLIVKVDHLQEELETEIELTDEGKNIDFLITQVELLSKQDNNPLEWDDAIAELMKTVDEKDEKDEMENQLLEITENLPEIESQTAILIEEENKLITNETENINLNLSLNQINQSLEIVVDDDIEEEISSSLPPVKKDTSGIPYPQEVLNQNPSNLSIIRGEVPPPTILINQKDLIAGEGMIVDLKLPPYDGSIYVKLWVQDRQSRNLLTGPIALVDLTPNRKGELEAMTQIIIPFGAMEISVSAIAINPESQQESHKVVVNKIVLPTKSNS